MKSSIYIHNGKRLKVKAMKLGHMLWMHVNGETWAIDQKPKVNKKSGSGNADALSGEILAPMPGKILRLNVKKGESVEKDQIIVVMEAMKMEYSLQAISAGSVDEILCRENQQVELGSTLIKINVKK